MDFDMPKDQSSIIKVVGVGGGGSNAVNHMFNQGIKGVDFIVCNTDRQALDISPVATKIQLGETLTEGRGAGSIPEIGKNAAIENIDEIKDIFANNTKMVFVTAGMGGGTGTGAAPIIAQAAKDMGILTVGIVTVPFTFEGRKRKLQAEEGLEEMRNSVDTLLVINNDRLREMFGNLSLGNAFAQADNVLTAAAKGIAEVISVTGIINVDFNDVNTVMKDSGVAIMGSAKASGENRAITAVQEALASPLLNDNDIVGADYVLLNITYGNEEVLMDEISEITDYIQEEAGSTAELIWGHGFDESMEDELGVTLVATGFKTSPVTGFEKEPQKKKHSLEDTSREVTEKVDKPAQANTYVESDVEDTNEPYLKSEDDEKTEDSEHAEQKTLNWDQPTEKQSESTAEDKEVKRYYLEDDMEETSSNDDHTIQSELSPEEQQEKAQERIQRIKEISSRLKSPNGLNDLENEPAYRRRNVDLKNISHSSEEETSRYSLDEDEDQDGEKKTGLSGNNSFLHDNVD